MSKASKHHISHFIREQLKHHREQTLYTYTHAACAILSYNTLRDILLLAQRSAIAKILLQGRQRQTSDENSDNNTAGIIDKYSLAGANNNSDTVQADGATDGDGWILVQSCMVLALSFRVNIDASLR